MTTEEDDSRYPPKIPPRDRPTSTGDATRASSPAPTNHQNGAESILYTVIELLAETLDEDPTSMRPPLGDVIDPEILVRLQRRGDRSEQTFTFRYRDAVVTATNRGAVRVRRAAADC